MGGATVSATQFAWACLGSPAWPPPEPKRDRAGRLPSGQSRFGTDDRCWLCGGSVEPGTGWPRRVAFAETFTNHNLARVPTSETACQACVYLSSGESWKAYAAAHPEMGLKAVHPLSWRTYSHVFSAAGHECPQRARWRALLIDPPEPPFTMTISESGQKHIVFRGSIAYDREVFPVQCEEDTLIVNRRELADCFAAFEALYALGFSKQEVKTGRYNTSRIMAAGMRRWRYAEAEFAPWRYRKPDFVRIVDYCAQRRDTGAERSI